MPSLKQIYDADQKDREAPLGKALDGETIGPRDTARRKRVRELIDQGRLNTGKDYERAAMVFQQGEGSDDILLAHVLLTRACPIRKTRPILGGVLGRPDDRINPRAVVQQLTDATALESCDESLCFQCNRVFGYYGIGTPSRNRPREQSTP